MDALSLQHELGVHQIELELQNKQLRRTLDELEAAREKYFDLYGLRSGPLEPAAPPRGPSRPPSAKERAESAWPGVPGGGADSGTTPSEGGRG